MPYPVLLLERLSLPFPSAFICVHPRVHSLCALCDLWGYSPVPRRPQSTEDKRLSGANESAAAWGVARGEGASGGVWRVRSEREGGAGLGRDERAGTGDRGGAGAVGR